MSIVNPDWLAERIGAGAVRVLDVRWYLTDHELGRHEYAEGHIPGAVFMDLEEDLSDLSIERAGRHPLPEPTALKARFERVGIGTDLPVVTYDHGPSSIAARAWWLLRKLGHPDVHVLDGGIEAWKDAGHPLSDEVPDYPVGTFASDVTTWEIADLPEVADRGDTVLLDARAPERFRGEVEPADPIAGHIPGAVNLPTTDLVGSDQRLLPPDELRARFAETGAGPDEGAIASCGSGVTACHLVLAASVAGLPEPRLYPGSYSQWVREGMPVETGD